MTGSLRESCAEILEGLAFARPYSFSREGQAVAHRLFEGAATLRWADDPVRDPDGIDAETVEAMEWDLERHERAVGEVRDLWTAQLTKATALSPAEFRDAIGAAIAEL